MAAPSPPAPTLRALLARTELRLRLATEAASDLDAPIRWIHSSDLADPTPFLSEDVVLLTTGTQFSGADAVPFGSYVDRLRARGVRGLGFGTEVVRDGIPPRLLRACRERGIPLFEVPYRTPFIAVARANAEAIAAQSYARRSWALAAQHALSLAALRPDGFDATLAELARQLDAWVGLYDATGALTHGHPAAAPAVRSDVDAEVSALLRRGGGAGASVRLAGTPVSLQTLGAGGGRGVLAIVGADLDQDARGVVTAVAATAGLALEQRRQSANAGSRLRGGLARLIEAGEMELVRDVATDTWGSFPASPLLAAMADATAPTGARELLDQHASSGALFYGRVDGGVLIVVGAAQRGILGEIAARLHWRIGVSAPVLADEDLAAALASARLARDRGTAGAAIDLAAASGDLLSEVATDAARRRAAAELAPLRAHDARHGAALEETLRAWLDGDGAHEATARVLGVHRHTVRTRIALAQTLLGRDLSRFSDRAAVWTALRLAGD